MRGANCQSQTELLLDCWKHSHSGYRLQLDGSLPHVRDKDDGTSHADTHGHGDPPKSIRNPQRCLVGIVEDEDAYDDGVKCDWDGANVTRLSKVTEGLKCELRE